MGAPECTLPGLWGRSGVRLTFGPAERAFGRAARSAVALEAWRAFRRAVSPSVWRGGARALAPRLRQKQRTRRSSCSQTHVSIVSGRVTEHVFVCVVTDDLERSDRGVQIVPPLLLQFSVRVKRLRIRIHSWQAPSQNCPAQ